MFWKRAPETKKLLAAVFKHVMNNCLDTYVKQRAIFLYRLMQTDQEAAKELAFSSNNDFEIFFEDRSDECRERLFWEFNSLSVVYQKPSERFLRDGVLKHALASEKKYFPDRVRKITEDVPANETTPLVQETGQDMGDLLDFGGAPTES